MYQPRQHHFNHVKEVIASQHIDCQHQVADVYYSRFKKSQIENYFLAICYQQDSIDDYKNCISYRRLTGS